MKIKKSVGGLRIIIVYSKRGVDILGMPKLVGWNYVEDKIDLTVSYFERVARKVKVRGDYGRYIEVRNIRRVLVSPSAGTSSSVFGSGEANCMTQVTEA